jgi:hypothetical protein
MSALEEPLLGEKKKKKKLGRLGQLLEDVEVRELWCTFLQQNYCYENMMFYDAVEEYQFTSSPADRAVLARYIYVTFVDEGAENQVNLDSAERRAIQTAILRLPPTPADVCCHLTSPLSLPP